MKIRPREARHFIEDLTATLLVGEAVDTALKLPSCGPTMVTGDAGTGKSTALQHFAALHNGVYCHASHRTKTVKGLYQLLLDSAEHYYSRSFTQDLAELVYSRFDPWGGKGRLIIVDEVQNIGLDALRELLNLQETCGLPMVLSGNDKRLAQTKTHAPALDQIVSRIGVRVRLGKPASDDCTRLAEAFGVADTRAVAALANYGQNTSLRELSRILEMATTDGGTIEFRHVEQRVRLFHGGDRKALKLLEAA